MKKKFSQGEWTSKRSLIKCNDELVAYTATLISSVDETRLDGESWLDMRYITNSERLACSEEEMANTRLIAAAPELLNRLNSLVLSVKAHPDYQFGEEGDEWHDIVSLAEETIKKATVSELIELYKK